MEPLSTIEVSIVVIPKDTRAGTAWRFIQKQHHERMTRVTVGENTDDTKYSRRRLNENTTLRRAKEPDNENTMTWCDFVRRKKRQ